MALDTLDVLGIHFTNVKGFRAKATTDVSDKSYLRPQGSETYTENGTHDVTELAEAVVSIPSGTAGTPVATKSTPINHSLTITPSVTNTAGIITGGTKTGTAVTVSASELASGSETKTENGTYDVTNLATLVVNVSGGGGKNAQTVQQSSTRITATTYSKACGDITVSKTGTYDVYWSSYRTSSSGTWGTQLYINSSAYGTAQTTFTSSYYQAIHLTNVSLTANQKVAVYGRSRGSNYYLYVGQLTIIEA